MLKEFRAFILKGNLVEIAVAFIIALAFAAVVASFVADIVTPIIAAIFRQPDFSSLKIDIGESAISYGKFLNAVINFLIVAFAIFMIVRWINKLKRKEAADPTPAAAPPAQDIVLLTEIRDLLAKG